MKSPARAGLFVCGNKCATLRNKRSTIEMKKIYFTAVIIFLSLVFSSPSRANFISATPANYVSYLSTLAAGDTLYLAPGTYTSNLTLNGRNGTAAQPIVIMGDANLYSTVFNAQSCCNTVSITQCSYLVIKNLKLDGLNLLVDAVKGEGTTNNWAHHITLEYLNIVNYGADQQNVGISTKCHAWNWIIRKNIIIGAGTGLYLGNSNGDKPFVNGLIENNLVMNTVGYNMEIKQQLDTVRDNYPGTAVNGKTTIRYNVFCKESNGATAANARPNVLLGAFPSTGFGTNDYYEMYGNFFYQNPNEALLQVTGNTMLYENIFVNHNDPAGFRAVYVTSQNGFQPRDIKIFHNTVWAANSSGGIRLYDPNTSYQQYCYANAVFAPAPITNFTDTSGNVMDAYLNAFYYVMSATTNLSTLNLHPQAFQLTGTAVSSTLFQAYTDWDKDFNGDIYNWTFRGAYSTCCNSNGWQLQLDTMPVPSGTLTGIDNFSGDVPGDIFLFPNPATCQFRISNFEFRILNIEIYNMFGEKVYSQKPETSNTKPVTVNVSALTPGIYFINLIDERKNAVTKKFVKI
jgi:hypothetical protein